MGKLILRRPTEQDEAQVMAYKAEFEAAGDSMDGTSGLARVANYGDWLSACRKNERPETVPPGLVDATCFLAIEEETGTLVGMVDVRHWLNDALLQRGGHIGYSVRPALRRRGYAKAMLALALDFCRERGMERVLVTCNQQNQASARTILANGGVLENEVPMDGVISQRYWISLERDEKGSNEHGV